MRAYLKQRVVGRWLVVSPLMWGLLTACDSKPKEQTPPQVSEAAAAASAALEAAKAAAAEKAARKVIRRAKDDADLVVTPERRAKVAHHPPGEPYVGREIWKGSAHTRTGEGAVRVVVLTRHTEAQHEPRKAYDGHAVRIPMFSCMQ